MRGIRPAAALALLLAASTAHATEGGTGHYQPGALATLIDLPPTQPGWVVETMYLHYQGDASASRALPIAGEIAFDLDVESDAWLIGTLYTLEPTVLGAHYSLGAFLPLVWIETRAEVRGPFGGILRQKDDASGIGDLTLIPAMLAWEVGDWQLDGIFTIYAPTGDYDEGRLANTGLNYWTFDPTIGASYNNEEIGFNAALHTGFSFNTENDDTDYHSGAMFRLEASAQQLLPLGPGFAGVGAEFFLLEQIQADSGSGATLGDFEGRTLGIGPVLTYLLPWKGATFAAEVRWLPEVDVEKRLEGSYVWAKLLVQF